MKIISTCTLIRMFLTFIKVCCLLREKMFLLFIYNFTLYYHLFSFQRFIISKVENILYFDYGIISYLTRLAYLVFMVITFIVLILNGNWINLFLKENYNFDVCLSCFIYGLNVGVQDWRWRWKERKREKNI